MLTRVLRVHGWLILISADHMDGAHNRELKMTHEEFSFSVTEKNMVLT